MKKTFLMLTGICCPPDLVNFPNALLFFNQSSGIRGTSLPHPHEEFIHFFGLSGSYRDLRCRSTNNSIYYPAMTP